MDERESESMKGDVSDFGSGLSGARGWVTDTSKLRFFAYCWSVNVLSPLLFSVIPFISLSLIISVHAIQP